MDRDIRDLHGDIVLSGVDIADDAMEMVLVINGLTYEAIGDPDDGYRSFMGSFKHSTKSCINRFNPIMCYASCEDDWMEVRSTKTDKVCLRLGTESDDSGYYPTFVCEWDPVAAGVKENQ